MFAFFYNLYGNCIKELPRNVIMRFFNLMYRLMFFYFCNTVLIYYYKITKKKKKLSIKKTTPEIIVSLTSYPKRINTLWITIESLIRQNLQPDMIILWLAEDQFPNKILPESLIEQQKRGLTIKWCENLMSHKKYYYVFKEFPESNIITADDDSIYPPFLVNRLWNMHLDHPNDVITMTSQTIYPSYSTPPSKWCGVSHAEIISSFKISLNSGSGALFPPNCLPKEAFDKNLILKLCPYADDLWLTVMTHINNVKTSKYSFSPFPIVIKSTQSDSLCSKYNSLNSNSAINNDTQWYAIINEYSKQLKQILGDFF